MELSPKQQICELVQKSKKILIVFGQNPDGDSIGSAFGLALMFRKLNKEAQIVSSSVLPEKFSFLPLFNETTAKPILSRDYIISINVPKNTISQLRYEVENEKMNIYISANGETISKEDISFEPFRFKYDLIFAVNTPDLENLGEFYEKNTELFFETPIINIDHHPSNEYFGKVNLVEIPVSSTAEIIAGLAGTLEIELDEDIANCLLVGIISSTNSFQKTNTTPNSFTVAASLMSAGANQQEIVRFLYKTKSLSVLKLWGRVMSLLKHNSDLNLAWSVIEEKIFSETKTSHDDLKQIIKEIAPGSRDFNTIMFLWEKDEKFYGLIQTIKEAGKEELSKLLNGRIEKDGITFTQEAENIAQAEQNALTVIKQWTEEK
jgi:phosphoesterase RecJ-like protein